MTFSFQWAELTEDMKKIAGEMKRSRQWTHCHFIIKVWLLKMIIIIILLIIIPFVRLSLIPDFRFVLCACCFSSPDVKTTYVVHSGPHVVFTEEPHIRTGPWTHRFRLFLHFNSLLIHSVIWCMSVTRSVTFIYCNVIVSSYENIWINVSVR